MGLSRVQLEGGLVHLRRSPVDVGTVEMIVGRPAVDERVVLDSAELTGEHGLVGDNWAVRPRSRGGAPDPDRQLTLMNARTIALIAERPDRWPLAGDQLYVDLDLSVANLPAGTRLRLGTAVVEVTPPRHKGCVKFVARFGLDALRFVNSPLGRQLRLRGMYVRVVAPGVVRVGDHVRRAGDSAQPAAPGS